MLRLGRAAGALLRARVSIGAGAGPGARSIVGDAGADVPMIYNFGGVEPDLKAACLSETSKETIWRTHSDNPGPSTVERLAAEFRVSRQRVHAILWLKEGEKREEAASGAPLDDALEKELAELHGSHDFGDGERYGAVQDWGAPAAAAARGGEEQQQQGAVLSKEEQMLVEEFEQRMSFNKKIISGVVKTGMLSRRRPAEGWSYVVEELGSEGKRGKHGGGRRFIALPNGTQRPLNDLEKEFLRRETLKPRRRVTPR